MCCFLRLMCVYLVVKSVPPPRFTVFVAKLKTEVKSTPDTNVFRVVYITQIENTTFKNDVCILIILHK